MTPHGTLEASWELLSVGRGGNERARSEGRETRDLLRAELEVEDVEVLLVRVRVRGRGLRLGSGSVVRGKAKWLCVGQWSVSG